MPCSPLKINRRFGGTYRLRLRGRISRVNSLKADGKPSRFRLNQHIQKLIVSELLVKSVEPKSLSVY
jgi:hypothetical protein